MRRVLAIAVVLASVAALGGCRGLIDGSPWGHVEGSIGAGDGANPCDRCAPAPAREPRLAPVK